MGGLEDRSGRIRAVASQDPDLGPLLLGKPQFRLVNVCDDDASAGCSADLHGGQSDGASAVDREPLT